MSGKRVIMTVPEVAGMVGLHEQTVRAHVHDADNPLPILGVPKRGTHTRVVASQAFAYYRDREIQARNEAAARRLPDTPENAGDPDVLDFNTERARKEQATADRLQLQLAKEYGELVPTEDAQRWLSVALSEVASLLDAVYPRLKSQLPHLQASDMDVIQREIARARNHAADKAESGFDPARCA